jgi:hypothetical protein
MLEGMVLGEDREWGDSTRWFDTEALGFVV